MSATLFGLGVGKHTVAPTWPILGSAPSPTQHQMLQNFFKSLRNRKDGDETWNLPDVASRKTPSTGPRTSGDNASDANARRVFLRTDPDADSGTIRTKDTL